ncbi:MAG TPA: dienelactone hydrolase family protein [Rhizomicrobium sp.]|nr:dienelactone hydrolase family protein [Rhizomicrobium sp.]
MDIRGLALALLMLVAAPAQAAAPIKQTLPFEGQDRTFYLYVPDGGQGPMPMVVVLHGSGGNGAFMISRWQDVATREHIVLLAPDSLHTDVGWDLRDDGPNYIHAAIQAVASGHQIDFHRLYLFGQSGGAVYALNLAMLESEYFAAAAYHAGGWRKPAEYHFTDYAKRKIPVAAFVGDKDEYFSMPSVQETEKVLTQRGFPAELHLLAGRVHAYTDVPADFHDTVWNFLKTNVMTDLPKYAPYRLGGAPMK